MNELCCYVKFITVSYSSVWICKGVKDVVLKIRSSSSLKKSTREIYSGFRLNLSNGPDIGMDESIVGNKSIKYRK